MSDKKTPVEKSGGEAARCPYCMKDSVAVSMTFTDVDTLEAGRCAECERLIVRVNGSVVYPRGPVPQARFAELPEKLRELCGEACSIADISPRAACSLLMPYVERMCDALGAQGDTLVDKIKHLRKTGKLPADVSAELASGRDQEEEIEDARKRAYDLMSVAGYLGSQSGDF